MGAATQVVTRLFLRVMQINFFNGDTNSGYITITGLAWSKVGVAPFTS